MRRCIHVLIALAILAGFPTLANAQDTSDGTATPAATACAPAGAVETEATPTADDEAANAAALAAIARLPPDHLPAQVSRGEDAEHGVLTLSLPGALAAITLSAEVNSADAGPIGRVTRDGDVLVFAFDEITYDVTPIDLVNGRRIEAQSIRLDPAKPSTLCVDLTTGRISRHFHWLLTGTNVEYDGQPTIALGDTGRATIAEVTEVDAERYTIRLLTHWQSAFTLTTWGVDGTTLPSGRVEAAAEFDGTYLLEFRK